MHSNAISVQLAPDQGMQPADQPSELRRRCEEESQDVVRLSNALPDGEQRVQSPGLTQLVSRLTALLLQIRVPDYTVHPCMSFTTTFLYFLRRKSFLLLLITKKHLHRAQTKNL